MPQPPTCSTWCSPGPRLARFGNGLENCSFAVEDAQVRDYATAGW
jgi:hypothetical protein